METWERKADLLQQQNNFSILCHSPCPWLSEKGTWDWLSTEDGFGVSVITVLCPWCSQEGGKVLLIILPSLGHLSSKAPSLGSCTGAEGER